MIIIYAIFILLIMLLLFIGRLYKRTTRRDGTDNEDACIGGISEVNTAKRFYDVEEVCPELVDIPRDKIMNELMPLYADEWIDWPEKKLWDAGVTGAKWTVFPFIAFGRKVRRNCERAPELMKFINNIDEKYGVSIAILSRLGPGMKLVPHQGWGAHSNTVLRCHYGLVIPSGECTIKVADCKCECTNEGGYGREDPHEDSKNIKCKKNCYNGYVYESRRHNAGKWIIFDDSKLHMAENASDGDRIVLIMDILRPDWIPPGTSMAADTTELKNLLAEYNINT